MISRRTFVQGAAATIIGSGLLGGARAQEVESTAKEVPKGGAAPGPVGAVRLRKAIKYDSVGIGNTPAERMRAIRAAGFEGVEIDSPNRLNREEVAAAAKEAGDGGIKIHGMIDSVHWQDRLSDPDPAVRARGLAAIKTALNDAKFFGATTVLVVPGKVSNAQTENYQQVWDRSTEQIKLALPTALETGVMIAIEVVWNGFITKPEELVKYVDQFASPLVGAYFDCSNMVKFGVPSADWIRALGKRMLKFDFKGYSKKNGWVKIGEGDEDWPEILKALTEVGYEGWATAEVPAANEAELMDISQRMKKNLGI